MDVGGLAVANHRQLYHGSSHRRPFLT